MQRYFHWPCILAFFLVGCGTPWANTGPKHQVGKARVCVLRRFTALGGGPIKITENGKSVGKIDRGGILQFETEPGTVIIEASGAGVSKLTVDAAADKQYFVEVRKSRVPGSRSRKIEIHSLSDGEGKRLLEMNRQEGDPQRGWQGL
jgi:hypothetical protein